MLKAVTDSLDFLLHQEMSRAVAPAAHKRAEELVEQLHVALAETMFDLMPARPLKEDPAGEMTAEDHEAHDSEGGPAVKTKT